MSDEEKKRNEEKLKRSGSSKDLKIGGDRKYCEFQTLGKMECLLALLQHCNPAYVLALNGNEERKQDGMGIIERILKKCEFCLYVFRVNKILVVNFSHFSGVHGIHSPLLARHIASSIPSS